WFRDDGSLRDFDVDGPVLGQSASYKAFTGFLSSHPDLTNAEAIAGLEQAEPMYPPQRKDKFRNALPTATLERYLGRLRIRSVEFSPPIDNDRFTGTAEWIVVAERSSQDGPHVTYEMRYEPFDGHLIWLREKPPAAISH